MPNQFNQTVCWLAIAAALAYFLSPANTIPDLLAGVGFTDDTGIIAGAIALSPSSQAKLR
jgi:uncharacterized membrane protein YkvA (DUF1232 family)